MILAGWSLPRLLLARNGIAAELVIGRCEIEFLAPVPGDFRAFCPWPAPSETTRFLARLAERGRGRMDLAPEIHSDGRVAARLAGRYAAIVSESPSRNPR